MRFFNFGIIGCGRISKKHFSIFKNKISKKLKLVAICDIDVKKMRSINKKGNLEIYKNYKDLLNNKKIHVVIILTESGNHFKISSQALKNNKHVIVEKPLCLKINEAKRLIKMSNKLKKKIFVVMQNRFNNPIVAAKKFIQKKKLGKLVTITARVRWRRDNSYYKLDNWRGTWSADGGALTNQGIHHIDLLQYLGGKIKKVSAFSATRLANIETEDTAVGIVEFENGALGTIEVTTAARPKDLEGSISILGEKGTIEIGGFAANKINLWSFKNKKSNILEKKYYENPKNINSFGHKKFYLEVEKSLQKKNSSAILAKDSLHSLEILHALYSSIYQKKNFSTKFE